ncbi:MAG: efflux RND transporter periplasmic adaptor subunit [Bdellovibrionales bacterium]|nr:efflux RND transporter periplasmic adaptor subunit [Bdellovibrionales bacterium]
MKAWGFAGLLLAGSVSWAATDTIPVVQIKKVELTENSESLSYPARVESRVSGAILAEVEGVVRDVVTLGTHVKKGQVLFKIQQLDPVYQYAPAKIVAPVSGVVSQIEVTVGTQVTRGQRIATVVDPSQLRVTVEIPGSDLEKITHNAQVSFTTSLMEKAEDLSFEGISPLVNPTTGTATANLLFKNKNPRLSAGSIGKIQVTLKNGSAIRVSEQAVVYKGAVPYVRIVDDKNIAKYKAVELGTRQAGLVEIKKGLTANDNLIERASQYVQDNKAVKIEKD